MTVGIYWIYQHSRDRAVYVGSSKRYEYRRKEHLSYLAKGKHDNPHLQRTWDKYGANDFVLALLEITTLDKLIEREQFWMDALSPVCNIATAAENVMLGRKHTPETIAQMRATKLGKKHPIEHRINMRNAHLGTPLTDECKENMSKAHKGQKVTEETKEKIRLSVTARWKSGEFQGSRGMKFTGRVRSESAKIKTANANRGKKRTEEQKQRMRDAQVKNRKSE